jgi:hypothetical protein
MSTLAMSAIEDTISWPSSSTSQTHVSTVFHSTRLLRNGTLPISDLSSQSLLELQDPLASLLGSNLQAVESSAKSSASSDTVEIIQFLATIFTKTVCGLFSPLPARLLCLNCSNDRTAATLCSLPDVIWNTLCLQQALTA